MFDIGVAVIIAAPIGLIILALFRDRGIGTFLGIGLIGILSGVFLTALPSIHQIVVGLGGGKSVNVDFQQILNTVQSKATQVQTDTVEVRGLKDQIAVLAQRVQESEKSVADMRGSVRQAYQALFETLVYQIDTRSYFPPPLAIIDEMERRLTALGDFAYGSDQGRIAAVQHINNIIQHALATPTPSPTPTAKPTPH